MSVEDDLKKDKNEKTEKELKKQYMRVQSLAEILGQQENLERVSPKILEPPKSMRWRECRGLWLIPIVAAGLLAVGSLIGYAVKKTSNNSARGSYTTSYSSESNSHQYKNENEENKYEEPRVVETSSLEVYARNSGWTDTGIHVNAGDVIDLNASGSVVHWSSLDKSSSKSCGPDGTGGVANNSNYLAPGLYDMGLVGVIDGKKFNVGSSKKIVSPTSGRLYLGMNDTVHKGGSDDNSGSLNVDVTVHKK